MASEISVQRQFIFHCSCGATIETGERTVKCAACGITLGVRRVSRHRQQHPHSVAYYGSSSPLRRVESHRQQLKSTAATPISPGWTIPVDRVERLRQQPAPAPRLESQPMFRKTTQSEPWSGFGPMIGLFLLLLPWLIMLFLWMSTRP